MKGAAPSPANPPACPTSAQAGAACCGLCAGEDAIVELDLCLMGDASELGAAAPLARAERGLASMLDPLGAGERSATAAVALLLSRFAAATSVLSSDREPLRTGKDSQSRNAHPHVQQTQIHTCTAASSDPSSALALCTGSTAVVRACG